MRHQRWAQAADAFEGGGARDTSVELQLNICRNLASVREHRPKLYDILMSSSEPERYTIGVAATGHPTIFYRTDGGAQLSLSPGNEPVASLSSLFAAIKQNYQAGKSMAVLGIGDGYFLKACSLNPPTMAFESQQAVYLVEPDIQAVLACMTIHDYSGPGGPIEQRRFQWFVGGGCIEAARESLLGELFNPPPIFEVSQSPKSKEIGAALRIVFDELYEKYRGWQRENEAYYATITRESLAARIRSEPTAITARVAGDDAVLDRICSIPRAMRRRVSANWLGRARLHRERAISHGDCAESFAELWRSSSRTWCFRSIICGASGTRCIRRSCRLRAGFRIISRT